MSQESQVGELQADHTAPRSPSETTPLPSPADTENAINQIDEKCHAQAAEGIKRLARKIIAAMSELDIQFGVTDYLNSLEVKVLGRGNVVLNIDERTTAITTEECRQLVAEVMAAQPDAALGKLGRAIFVEE